MKTLSDSKWNELTGTVDWAIARSKRTGLVVWVCMTHTFNPDKPDFWLAGHGLSEGFGLTLGYLPGDQIPEDSMYSECVAVVSRHSETHVHVSVASWYREEMKTRNEVWATHILADF